MITADDNNFSSLRVWVDANLDPVDQPHKLNTPDNLGIDAPHLQARSGSVFNNSHWSVHTLDTHAIWFHADRIPMVTGTQAAQPQNDPNDSHLLQLLMSKDAIVTSWG